MKTLLIGGTGLISTGIIKQLRARGETNITIFNRAKTENRLAAPVTQITGDRDDFASFENRFAAMYHEGERFDVVIDMICYTPAQAQSDIRAFAGKCKHFIFCSTVCTYGSKIPNQVAIVETFPQEPISEYGKNKLECEKVFLDAFAKGDLNTTIIRPSSTYGPGGRMIDNLEFNPPTWDRIEKGLPVLCSGDGLALWVSTHRDDVGKLFAHACLNRKTFGQSYNASRDRNFTWRDFYREAAQALGKPVDVLFMPAAWIIKHEPKRFNFLREISQFHGAYSSEKAKRDVPQFVCEIDFSQGAKETLADIKRRGAWRDSSGDELYNSMVKKALDAGVEPIRL